MENQCPYIMLGYPWNQLIFLEIKTRKCYQIYFILYISFAGGISSKLSWHKAIKMVF